MTEPPDDIRVTAELRDLGDRWEAHACGGPMMNPIDLRIERPTREEVEAAFIEEWNERANTSWTAEQYSFVPSD